jgi:hypothetical protein
MKTINQQLLEQLKSALATNHAAIKRVGMGHSVSKTNMQETEITLQNAIRLLEEVATNEEN